jgi:hypothetical protein
MFCKKVWISSHFNLDFKDSDIDEFEGYQEEMDGNRSSASQS